MWRLLHTVRNVIGILDCILLEYASHVIIIISAYYIYFTIIFVAECVASNCICVVYYMSIVYGT